MGTDTPGPRPGRGAAVRAADRAAHRHLRRGREHRHRHRAGAAGGFMGGRVGPGHPALRRHRQQHPAAAAAHLHGLRARVAAVADPAGAGGVLLAGPDHHSSARWSWACGTSQEVEAARALGASTRHIIRRHVFPHTAPYVFTQLIFFVPAADPGRGRAGVPGPGRPVAADLGPGPRERLPARAPCSSATGGGWSRRACSSSSRPSRSCSWRWPWSPSSTHACGGSAMSPAARSRTGRGVRHVDAARCAPSTACRSASRVRGEALGIIGESGSGKSQPRATRSCACCPATRRLAGGRVLLRGAGHHRAAGRGVPARGPLEGHRDGVPGRDAGAQPGHPRRRPGGRAAARTTAWPGATRGRGSTALLERVGLPAGTSSGIPTSCRVA